MPGPYGMLPHVGRIVTPPLEVRRAKKKRRGEDALAAPWCEALAQVLDAPTVIPADEVGAERDASCERPDTPSDLPHAAEKLKIDSAADFDRALGEIRKMADEPERLMESHLNVFLDPAPPGRLLSAKG